MDILLGWKLIVRSENIIFELTYRQLVCKSSKLEWTNGSEGFSAGMVRAAGCSGFPKRSGTWHYVSVIMSVLNTVSEIT